MENVKAQRAWWPLVRRMVGWGLLMAFYWGWFPFLFGGDSGLLLWQFPEKPDAYTDPDDAPYFNISFDSFFTYLLVVSCFLALGGAITGAFAAFFAPASEPRNPFKSSFFRLLGRDVFWRWFWYRQGLLVIIWLYFAAPELPFLLMHSFCSWAFFIVALWQSLDDTLDRASRR